MGFHTSNRRSRLVTLESFLCAVTLFASRKRRTSTCMLRDLGAEVCDEASLVSLVADVFQSLPLATITGLRALHVDARRQMARVWSRRPPCGSEQKASYHARSAVLLDSAQITLGLS